MTTPTPSARVTESISETASAMAKALQALSVLRAEHAAERTLRLRLEADVLTLLSIVEAYEVGHRLHPEQAAQVRRISQRWWR